jgi:assimilatory nitrate reductase catalytic subunit
MKVIVADPRRTDTAAAGRPAPAAAARHRRDAVPRPAAHHAVGRLDRPAYIAAHTTGFEALRNRWCATARPSTWRRLCGMKEAEDLCTAARWFAGLDRPPTPRSVAVLPGPEPEQQRHRQERHPDQPAPGHRPDRQARRRAVLADRPAQRDGRARGGRPGQPAERPPRPGQPRAPRRSGRAVGRGRVPDKPGKTAVEMFQAAADGEIKALWIACTNPAQSMPDQATVRRALQRAEFVVVQEAFATHRHLRLCRPAAARHHLGREGRHGDQQRAPHQPRARRRAAAGEARHDWQIAWTWRAGWNAPGPGPQPVPLHRCPEAIWNEHREARAAATSTSPA